MLLVILFVFRRLHYHVHLDYPTRDDIRAIIRYYKNQLICEDSIDLEPAVDALYRLGATGSEVESFVRSAYMNAVSECINNSSSGKSTATATATEEEEKESSTSLHLAVHPKHFDLALQRVIGVIEEPVVAATDTLVIDAPPLISSPERGNTGSFEWNGQFSVGL